MYEPMLAATLHALVHRLERSAVDEWRNAHFPGYSVVDALALDARELNTDLKRKPGGYIAVTVSVESRRPFSSETWWFSLQRDGNFGYRVRELSSTLG